MIEKLTRLAAESIFAKGMETMKAFRKQILALAVLLIAVFTLAPIAGAAEAYDQEITLQVGDTYELEGTGVIFESDVADICDVVADSNGAYVASAISAGTTVITGSTWQNGDLKPIKKILVHVTAK